MKKELILYGLAFQLLACKNNSVTETNESDIIELESQKAIEKLDERINEANTTIKDALHDIEQQMDSKKGGFEKFKKDSTMENARIIIQEYKD